MTAKINTNKYPYKMECEITVITINPSTKVETREVFRTAFPLDEVGVKSPWFVLANHLAPAYVTKKLGRQGTTWSKIYERRIIKVENVKDAKDIKDIPIRVMTFEQLQEFCKYKELPIKVKDFHDVDIARRMVRLYLDDPTAYKLQYEQYIEGKTRQYPEFDEYRKNADDLVGVYDDTVDKTIDNRPKNTKPKNSVLTDM